MYRDARLLFLYVETPLHAGAGSGLGAIDLPIQRERVTGYPMVQASGVKGALRSAAPNGKYAKVVFGPDPDTDQASEHAGAFSPGDGRILLFPVRSVTGVFAWTTSLDALRRWHREAKAAGIPNLPELPDRPPSSDDQDNVRCYVSGRGVSTDGVVVLEEFAFTVDNAQQETVSKLADWLATNALPADDEYKWWGDQLRQKLVVLPDDEFRDFTQYATEVLTRIRLSDDTKTVVSGALWTEEHLPTDTLLYTPVRSTRFRAIKKQLPDDWQKVEADDQGAKVLDWVRDNVPARLQLGGDETIGRGIVSLRWSGGQ